MVSFTSLLSFYWATAVLASTYKLEHDIPKQPDARLVRREPDISTAVPASTTSTPTPTPILVPHWAQCGGLGWTGPTVCAPPYTCVISCSMFSASSAIYISEKVCSLLP